MMSTTRFNYFWLLLIVMYLLPIYSFGRQSHAAQIDQTGDSLKLFFPAKFIPDKEACTGKFWLGSILGDNQRDVVIINDYLLEQNNSVVPDGFSSLQQLSNPQMERFAIIAGRKYGDQLNMQVYTRYDHLAGGFAPQANENKVENGGFVRKLNDKVYLIEKSQQWNYRLDDKEWITIWHPGDAFAMNFSSLNQATELLVFNSLAYAPHGEVPGNVIEIADDQIKFGSKPVLISREGGGDNVHIFAWSNAGVQTCLELPKIAENGETIRQGFGEFDPLDVSATVFERLKNRSYSYDSAQDKAVRNEVKLVQNFIRTLKSDHGFNTAISKFWKAKNQFQAKWFPNQRAIPPNLSQAATESSNGQNNKIYLNTPGLPEIVFASVDDVGNLTEFGVSDERKFTQAGNYLWPSTLSNEKVFGRNSEFTLKTDSGKFCYVHNTEVNMEQWLTSQGSIGDMVFSRELNAVLGNNDNQNPIPPGTVPSKISTIRKNAHSEVELLNRIWKQQKVARPNSNWSEFTTLSWGRLESTYALQTLLDCLPDEVIQEDAKLDYITSQIQSLLINSWNEYFVHRAMAQLDFNQSPRSGVLNDQRRFGVDSGVFVNSTNDTGRRYLGPNDPHYQRMFLSYANPRDQHFAPSSNDPKIDPSFEPVVFIRPFHAKPIRTVASAEPSENSPPRTNSTKTPIENVAHRIVIFEYGNPQSLSGSIRLPTTNEIKEITGDDYNIADNSRNWPFDSGKASPYVSEWACDFFDNGMIQFKLVGKNRWSQESGMENDLKGGIDIGPRLNDGSNEVPQFSSPVISMRWVIEVTPNSKEQGGAQSGSSAPVPTSSMEKPTTARVATEAKDPVLSTLEKNDLNTELNEYLKHIFGDGQKDDNSNVIILSASSVQKSIEKTYGNHPYWKLQYLRYLVFSGHWGPRKAISDSPDSSVVPHDNLTDCKILQELRMLFPSERNSSDCAPVAPKAKD